MRFLLVGIKALSGSRLDFDFYSLHFAGICYLSVVSLFGG
jgi:hypothetical protein